MEALTLALLVVVMLSFASGIDPVIGVIGMSLGILIFALMYVILFEILSGIKYRRNKSRGRVIHKDGSIEVLNVEK